MLKKNSLGRFLGSTGWQVANQIYTMLLSLVVGAITARYLGPSNYGLIGYGQSMVSLFVSFSTLGMNGVVVKELIQKPDERGEIIGTAFVMRLISSMVCMGMIAGLLRVIEPGNTTLYIVTFLQSFALVLRAFEAVSYWFQAKLEYKFISIASMVGYTFVCIWRIALLANGVGVEWFAASSCVEYLVSSAVVVIFFLKRYRTKLTFKFNTAQRIFKQSYHFILSGIAIALYTQVDKIMLGSMMDSKAVGYYTAATMIATLWEFVPTAIINSAKVLILEKKGKDEKEYTRLLSLLLCGVSAMSVIVCIALLIFGKLAIFILYGQEYMVAYVPLTILMWSTGFAMIGSARGSTWILAENLNKYSKYYVFISSIVNILLNSILIPLFGMNGAAFATLISQITTAFIAPAFFKETRSFIGLYFRSWKISIEELKNFVKRKKKENA